MFFLYVDREADIVICILGEKGSKVCFLSNGFDLAVKLYGVKQREKKERKKHAALQF